jgi:hypothetical protein
MPDSGTLIAGGVAATLFGVFADLAYNTYSATNSSPQTTELFAGERSKTLWKYVKLGHLQVAGLCVFGAWISRSYWPLVGGGIAAVIMHGMYSHALKAGQAAQVPGVSPGSASLSWGNPT